MFSTYPVRGPYGLDPKLSLNVVPSVSGIQGLGCLLDSSFVPIASGTDVPAYWLDGILMPDGVTNKPNEYLTDAEAQLTTYMLRLMPVGGVQFAMQEDSIGGAIADSALAAGTIYYDITKTDPTDNTEAEKTADGRGAGHTITLVDSSTGSSSATGKCVKIISVFDPTTILGAYPKADGTPETLQRWFLIEFLTPAVSQT